VSPAPSTADTILRAAEQVVLRDGISALTIETVARTAGLSKGGVLYHYPSKEKLIEGLISRLIDHFQADLNCFHAQQTEPRGAWTRAFVQTTLKPGATACAGAHSVEVYAALNAALATNPDLLQPLRERYERWQQQLEEDGLDPARATVARLAADGLWFAELLGFGPPRGTLREQVLAEMMRLSQAQER
jgi:AcrR family transcriptional regulator